MYPDCLLTALLQVTNTKSGHFLYTENFNCVLTKLNDGGVVLSSDVCFAKELVWIQP